jgi:hypothetical protein
MCRTDTHSGAVSACQLGDAWKAATLRFLTAEAKLKHLHVQLQPERVAGFDLPGTIDLLRSLGREHAQGTSMTSGEDDGQYVNIDFDIENVSAFWLRLREQLRTDNSLASCLIVCCEGEDGWNDYLLLHHFDTGVELDELT